MSSRYFRVWPLSTAAKTIVTTAALAAAYARLLGRKAELASIDLQDAKDTGKHPTDLGKTGRQLTWAQWGVPALTRCCPAAGAWALRRVGNGGRRAANKGGRVRFAARLPLRRHT